MNNAWSKAGFALILLSLGALTLPPSLGAQGATTTLALEGNAAPGAAGGTFSFLFTPALNSAGQAAFFATVTGSASSQGIFRSSGTPVALARADDAAPGAAGGTFSGFGSSPALNSAGQAAFFANVTGSASTRGIFRSSGTPVALAREDDTAPGVAGGTFFSFFTPALNSAGQAAFSANVTGSASTRGVFRSSGTPVALAREDDTAPGAAGGTFSSFGSTPALNSAGQAAFFATVTGSASTRGIFRSSGTPVALAREDDAAPGAAGGTFFGFFTPALNSAGQAAFRATVTGSASTQGIFRSDGTPVALAREDDAAPGAAGGTFSGFGTFPALNSAGTAAFFATVTGSPSDRGIFRSDGTPVALAREDDTAPGAAGGTFSTFGSPALNSAGTAAFFAQVTGSASTQGIFLADSQQVIAGARAGDSLAGSTITTVSFLGGTDRGGTTGLNDFGQIAYQANLASGSSGTFLFTPELHYRSSSSGSWDTSSNWTVGLAPGAPHPVVIDPTTGLSVTGPAGNVSISSLTIGAKVGGTAVLRTNGGGNLTVANGITIQSLGQLNQQIGTLTADSLTNAGFLTQAGGTTLSLGSWTNTATASLAGSTTTTGAAVNQASMTVSSGGVVTADGGLTNLGTLTLNDGTLSGAGGVTNDFGAQLTGKGTISTSLVNNGNLNTTGLLTVNGAMTNLGQMTLATATNLRPSGGLTNFGVIELDSGVISGSGAVSNQAGGIIRGGSAVSAPLTNDGGLIHANSSGTLVITNLSGGNINGGELRVEDGSAMNIFNPFSTSGTVVLKGTNATLAGIFAMVNTGTVSGIGRVGNPVVNSGIIRPEGGQLTLSGSGGTNTASGRVEAGTGATVFYTQGLATNAGTIALTGGRFDNNGQAVSNAGNILGNGTFSSGGLTNNNVVHFADAATDVLGSVTNDANLDITNNTTTFFDAVTNSASGTIKTTGATARFLGGLTNSGAFISDPSDNFFTNLIVNESGYLLGGAGDRFFVSGDFLNGSLLDTLWDTNLAELLFQGGSAHTLSLAGKDFGNSFASLNDNFAWGSFSLGLSQTLSLLDGNADAGGALYVSSFLLAGGLSQIASITGNGFNIYYDPNAAGNAYLSAANYNLAGGGVLAPLQAVPEPSSLVLLAFGLAALGWRSRQVRARA